MSDKRHFDFTDALGHQAASVDIEGDAIEIIVEENGRIMTSNTDRVRAFAQGLIEAANQLDAERTKRPS